MSLLDHRLPTLTLQAVLKRGAMMPEREAVTAISLCQTMAARAKVMQGKGLSKDTDPVDDIRAWFEAQVSALDADDNTTRKRKALVSTITEDDDAEQ